MSYMTLSVEDVERASALASIISCYSETGQWVPCVHRELNSPSVTNPTLEKKNITVKNFARHNQSNDRFHWISFNNSKHFNKLPHLGWKPN